MLAFLPLLAQAAQHEHTLPQSPAGLLVKGAIYSYHRKVEY